MDGSASAISSYDLATHHGYPEFGSDGGTLSGAEPRWLKDIEYRMRSFRNLRSNWDTYGARPVSQDAIDTALEILQHQLFAEMPRPEVVPSVQGGVQVEWCTNNVRLEIEFLSPLRTGLYFYDGNTGMEIDEDLEIDLRPVFNAAGRF